jgi:hypothetical protein
MYRGGAWKPRTQYHNTNGDRVFEGMREDGLGWLAEAAETYGLPIVTECMSEDDLRHFGRYLEPERDVIQIGARDSQNFALLYAVGGTGFGALLKSPQHGVDAKEAVGSLQRLAKNRVRIYCVRGQKMFINPDGVDEDGSFRALKSRALGRPGQHPDARNLNNIGAISLLRDKPYFMENGILFGYDPSHTFGGDNDSVRRMIGEQAVRAVKEFGYDLVEVEVNDSSDSAKCDADQALLTTLRNVDWRQTNAGQGPGVVRWAGRKPEVMPLTLVDIASCLMEVQMERAGLQPDCAEYAALVGKVLEAKNKLYEIRWDMEPG